MIGSLYNFQQTGTILIATSFWDESPRRWIRYFGGLAMRNLSDEMLIEAYERALKLNLNDDFIAIIQSEMERRALTVTQSLG
ncbi:sporulation histidine kinase inhibitor Sda [Salicibibacter cibi]